LEVQEEVVARMQRRVDEAHSDLARQQDALRHVVSEMKIREDMQSNPQNLAERKDLEELFPRLKSDLETLKATEPVLQAKASEAEQDLRAEQAKLSVLQDQLDRLDKSLENSNR
jgi:predicted DsbA family dithiol-disulfide isomerase